MPWKDLRLGAFRLGGFGPRATGEKPWTLLMGISNLPGGGPMGKNEQLSEDSLSPRQGPGLSPWPPCRAPRNQGIILPVLQHPPRHTDGHLVAPRT